MSRLLVMVPDRISQIIEKGEYQPNYYNPGELFDEVHILITNDDQPDLPSLRRTVGRAKLVVHNYPDVPQMPTRRLGFLRGQRLRKWAEGGVEIVRRIAPDMIRCHGSDWSTYLASRVKAELNIPYVTSLHINPDINPVRRLKAPVSAADKRHNAFYEYLEREALVHADLVMPVYKPILPYLDRLGVERAEVCYNALNGKFLREKKTYALNAPPHILYVGRLFADKDPSNIIRAVARMKDVRYTIVGDGPLRRDLEALIEELSVGNRVRLLPAVPNDDLCQLLADVDLFAIHTEHWEISKSLLEALLTGVPVVMNRRIGEPVPELEELVDGEPFVQLVDNTVEAYYDAITGLLDDDTARESLGRRAYEHAQEKWSPSSTEAKFVEIYKSILADRQGLRT